MAGLAMAHRRADLVRSTPESPRLPTWTVRPFRVSPQMQFMDDGYWFSSDRCDQPRQTLWSFLHRWGPSPGHSWGLRCDLNSILGSHESRNPLSSDDLPQSPGYTVILESCESSSSQLRNLRMFAVAVWHWTDFLLEQRVCKLLRSREFWGRSANCWKSAHSRDPSRPDGARSRRWPTVRAREVGCFWLHTRSSTAAPRGWLGAGRSCSLGMS